MNKETIEMSDWRKASTPTRDLGTTVVWLSVSFQGVTQAVDYHPLSGKWAWINPAPQKGFSREETRRKKVRTRDNGRNPAYKKARTVFDHWFYFILSSLRGVSAYSVI